MQKFLVLSLAILLATTACGCKKNTSEQESSSGGSSEILSSNQTVSETDSSKLDVNSGIKMYKNGVLNL